MVRASLYMKVKAGRGADFERSWREIAEEVRRAPGNVFVVTSDWDSREAFHEFERSPEQDDLTAPLRDLRESASMTVHELVAHIERGDD